MKARKIISCLVSATLLVMSFGTSALNAMAYDGDAAASYAVAWSGKVPPYTYNPYYVAQQNDCTNFASQCLKAGGWQMTSTSATGFVDGVSAISANSMYYLKSTNPITGTEHNSWSSTWTLVDAAGSQKGLKEYAAAHADLFTNLQASSVSSYLVRFWGVAKGDIIQFDWTGSGDYGHSVVVTDAFTVYANGSAQTDVILCTYHSNDTLMKSLDSIVSSYTNAKINVIKASSGQH